MIDRAGEEAYFAAVNSGTGFISFFEEIFYAPQISRRYVIKGGPGTGKSSFLRRVAKSAESCGRSVKYYYCSSDTDSLDGVVIDGSIALLDGTAPHSCDTVLAGACDEIINLGDFWDSDSLFESREDIVKYSADKKREYACAYSYLSAAARLMKSCKLFTARFAEQEKLIKNAQKLCGAYSSGMGTVTRAQMSAFGVHGRVHLDTLKNSAGRIWAVEDHYGVGALFMSELLRAARRRGCDVAVSYDTLSGVCPEEILFTQSGDLFYLSKNPTDNDRAIRCTRFVNKNALAELRGAYRASAQALDTLLAIAAERLSAAGKLHAQIEQIYVGAMHFDGVRKKCDEVIEHTRRYY